MSKTVRLVLALVLCVSAFFGEQIVDWVQNNVEIVNTPSVDVVEPSLAYKEVVKDISAMEINKEDAKQISDFFLELGDVVYTDPGFIQTTGNFREFNMTAGGLNFAGLELKGKYPQLGEKIDSVIVSSIGSEDQTLTDAKRSELVKCLNAIAWAVHQ
tara:strand:- start:95 stop:565 length:471 start_codon:yes stop_codon:yes gene_type:complete